MNEVLTNIGMGALTNAIYDVVKYICFKFFNDKKPEKKEIISKIEKKLSEGVSEDIKSILESATYVTYLKSPQCIDIINAYLQYKTFCNYSDNPQIKNYIKKNNTINYKDIITYISNNIYDLYDKNSSISKPTKSEIKKATLYILSVSEKIVGESLTPETSKFLYFLNSNIDYYYTNIIEMIAKLQETIFIIQQKEITRKNDDYEALRLTYHNILKDKNSDAHIYLLDKFPFEKFYVPPILQRASNEQLKNHTLYIHNYEYNYNSSDSWENIFERDNIVYLTGGAGYGKSLFTKKIINDYKDLNIFHSDEYIVIYGELKAFYPNGSDSSISVIDFLKESIKNSTLLDVPSDFITYYLNSGRCIILLDALDEVDKQKRAALHESIIAFFKNQNPNNKICITSRDRGFIPERNVDVLKICPLIETQIEKYVDNIIALGKFEENDKEAFMKQSEKLVQKGFLNSFLVLSLLINIYKAERELPENKLELYQKCFEYIANRREKDKTQKEFDWRIISPIMKDNTFIELSRMGMPNNTNIDRKDIKERLLNVYKAKYNSEVDTENAIDEFLKFCSDRTELFVPTSEDKYKFFHRSFFEYFYSLYIFLRCNNENEMLTELLQFDVDSEVFELTVAMLKQQSESKYQNLINLLFQNTKDEFNSKLIDCSSFNILVLSMQVVDDALYRKEFLNIIIDKKEKILNNLEKIHNLRLVINIFENDNEAKEKICEGYYDNCLMLIFDNCCSLFRAAKNYQNKNHIDYIKQLNDYTLSYKAQRRVVYKNIDADNNFYMQFFSKKYDCKQILLNTTDADLLRIYKKFSLKNHTKKVAQTKESIKMFSELTEKNKDIVIDYIMSSSFFIN